MILVLGVVMISCQKLDRPKLTNIILDPEPPPYNALKSFWAFENNANDEGESKLTATASNVTYAPGIAGQGIKFGTNGYVMLKAAGDTVRYPNEFVGLPIDTLRNLGSFSLAFWMNGPGPVQGGAQGLFAMSNSKEFWGNLELFLENLNEGSTAFLKVHMFNAGVASGNGEEWTEVKIPNALNKWTHIAVTYDAGSSKLSIFADGQPTGVANKVLGGGNYGKVKFNDFNGISLGTFAFQTTPTMASHGAETWARSFAGTLDQFRIYNKALSAAEINELVTQKK